MCVCVCVCVCVFFFFFFFLECPLRSSESNVRSSGGPGSVSSSGKSGTVSANARVPFESAKSSSETDRGSADPFADGFFLIWLPVVVMLKKGI